jgi:hypothetical protein
MRACLLVMNPREIRESVESILRLRGVSQAWFTSFTERELAGEINSFIRETDFDAYGLIADDCVASQEAIDAVLAAFEKGSDPVTGWTTLDRESAFSNVAIEPLIGDEPHAGAYEWWLAEDLEGESSPLECHFMGFALTFMSRELWLRFPFDCYGEPGFASDFHLSRRLRDAGVKMTVEPAARIEHLKERWNEPDQDPAKRLRLDLPKRVTVIE